MAILRLLPPWTDRQQWQLAYIAEFAVIPLHVPGVDNKVAHALSRPPVAVPAQESTKPANMVAVSLGAGGTAGASSSPFQVELDEFLLESVSAVGPPAPSAAVLAAAQVVCPSLADMTASSGLTLAWVATSAGQLAGDVSMGSFRPLVPLDLRWHVFKSLHVVAHPGVLATHRLVAARYVWPGLAKDVSAWARECVACQ